MFEGSYVAMVTDFKNGEVDYEAASALVKRLVEAGVQGIVPAGCTGEAATLSFEERRRLIEVVLKARGSSDVKVIPGTGSNSTSQTIDLTRMAEDLGADAAMLITPYYNKPTQAGLIKHYETVASKVKLPIVLYNVPGRTGVNMMPETVARLAEVDNIVAIKEASGSVDQVSRIASLCDITILSGDDSLTLPMLAVGARGVVSVVANLVPGEVARMVSAFLEGRTQEAREIHLRLLPLMHVLFIETNPCPVKAALRMIGHGTGEVRLPLVEVSEASKSKIESVLQKLSLLGR